MVTVGIIASLSASAPVTMGFDESGRLGHSMAYFLSMVWFGQLYPSRSGHLRVALLLIMLGICLEVLQAMWTDRVASVFDVAANVIGITCGWLLLYTRIRSALLWLDRRLAMFLFN